VFEHRVDHLGGKAALGEVVTEPCNLKPPERGLSGLGQPDLSRVIHRPAFPVIPWLPAGINGA
jgi:hypothetical protein